MNKPRSLNLSQIFVMFLLFSPGGFWSCLPPSAPQELQKTPVEAVKQTKLAFSAIPPDTMFTLKLGNHLVDIRTPKGQIKGAVIVLPGWSFSRSDWCEKASLCKKALERNYCLILPEMGKSIYVSRFFPETRPDWQVYPQLPWVKDTMITALQTQYGLLLPDQDNFLLGLSTGARGVALIALALPDLFAGAAALSGDYEQTLIPTDNLMIGYYGSYAQFKERWETVDNPLRRAAEFKTPLYLGHGTRDDVVPFEQSRVFYEALQKENPQLRVVFNQAEAKHDYAYWDAETKPVLDFFDQIIQNKR